MSEREFELYLSLLSRFLRLKPDQREEIADELRDHLAERLEELTAGGLSREEAIHQALEEFGDAADLAAHFTQLSRRRKRRLIMRCTVGTVVSTAALILIATAFWPQNRAVNLPPQLAAQDQPATADRGKQPAKSKPDSVRETPEAKIERVLENVTNLEIIDMPLEDLIDSIREQHGINVMLDTRVLKESSIDTSEVVNFQLPGIKFKNALKIILENLSEPLTYIIENEVLKITTIAEAEEQLSLQVYPVRDLLEGVEGKLVFRGQTVVPVGMAGGLGGGGFGGGGGGGFFAVTDDDKNNTNTTQPQLNQGSVVVYRQSAGEALISVITTTVQPDTWEVNGGSGSVEEFNGLMVVRAAQEVHREIEQLLKMMREAAKENVGRKKPIPGGFGTTPGGFGSTPGGFGSTPGGFGTTPGGFGTTPGGFGGFGTTPGGFGTRNGKSPKSRRNVPEAKTKPEN